MRNELKPGSDNILLENNELKQLIISKLEKPIENHFKLYTNKINFTSLKPLRSIPFDYIFLIGMNDDTFPRKEVKKNLNLMLEKKVFGDPNVEDSDNYLFLETILSCREELTISYVEKEESFASWQVNFLNEYIQDFGNYDCLEKYNQPIYLDSKQPTFNEENFLINKELNSTNLPNNKSFHIILEKIKAQYNYIEYLKDFEVTRLINIILDPVKTILENSEELKLNSADFNFFTETGYTDNDLIQENFYYDIIDKIKLQIVDKKVSFITSKGLNFLSKVLSSTGSFSIIDLEKIKEQYFRYFSSYERISGESKKVNKIKFTEPVISKLKIADFFLIDTTYHLFINKKKIGIKEKLYSLCLAGVLLINNYNFTELKTCSLEEEFSLSYKDDLKNLIKNILKFYFFDKKFLLYKFESFSKAVNLKEEKTYFNEFSENLKKQSDFISRENTNLLRDFDDFLFDAKITKKIVSDFEDDYNWFINNILKLMNDFFN